MISQPTKNSGAIQLLILDKDLDKFYLLPKPSI